MSNAAGQPANRFHLLRATKLKLKRFLCAGGFVAGGNIAANGKDAIASYADYRPDVFMIDIGLPGMNGYDLCKELKSRPDIGKAVFIAQTGWGEAEHRRMTAEAGFDHHLVKPLYLETLATVLGEIAKTR